MDSSPEMDALTKQYSSKSTLSMLLEESSESTRDKYNMDEEILYADFDPVFEQYNRKGASGSKQEKANFSCKDLIRAIYNSEISKNSLSGNDIFQSSSLTDSPTLTSFGLLAAEDDGSPMDDLPEFSTSTDVLAMGIEDFILIDKKTSAHLMHVRITQPSNCHSDEKNRKMSVGSTVEVMQYCKHNKELNKETTLGFEDLDMSGLDEGPSPVNSPRERQDSDSGRYAPDIIQMFRTQSEDDQMLASTLSLALSKEVSCSLSTSAEDVSLAQKQSDWRHTLSPLCTASPASPTSPRVRSSSGNLMISCRIPGTKRWSVPKSIPVPSKTTPMNRSALRIRAVSIATASNNKPPTPNRAIPTTATTGMRINTEFSKPMNRKNFDDTSSDPFRQYADQQARQNNKHRTHSNSLPEGELNAMLFSLNPHTSSSKMVLTPTNSTSRPSSALGSNSGEKKFLPPTGLGSSKNVLPPSVRVINATTTEGKTSPLPNTSSKELAAYFNTMSVNDVCSDSDEDDDDMGFGGGAGVAGHAFSFVDSLPSTAPIHNTSPGKPTTHGMSQASLSSKGSCHSLGIAVDVEVRQPDELTACSSGSDYSASDYEALHSIHVNVHADIMSKRGSGSSSNGHNSSQLLSILSPPRHPNNTSQPTTPTDNRTRTRTDSNVSVTRARTESESTKRPSLFERFFGSPSTKTRKTLDAAADRDNLSRRSSRNTMESRPPIEEEEDGDGTSFVRNLDTGAVIELDADGDGAVTAILVSPSVVFREERPSRQRTSQQRD